MLIQEPHTITIPEFSVQGVAFEPAPKDPSIVVAEWVEKFEAVLATNEASELCSVFRQDGWWRDMLALSWDFRTLRNLEDVQDYLKQNIAQAKFYNIRPRSQSAFKPSLKTVAPGVQWIESMFDFETKIGRGSGMIRLVQDGAAGWKAYMVYTALQELKGYEERTRLNRPHGGNNSLGGGSMKGNWHERREREKEFLSEEPAVIVIGAGQAGLDIAARLRQLGVQSLVIDRNQRIGDNWRSRYRTFVTHDPVQYCHMPYLPFPPNWPMFTAKDKLADWFEAYASIMEVNVWVSTKLESVEFDDHMETWTVKLLRGDGTTRIFHPHHIILATGQAGEAKVPNFPGQEIFKGTIYHTSQHQDASLSGDVTGKKVVVVGSGNSGHDICQNYYENGAEVTMLQRGGTYVITAKKGLFMLHTGVYEDYGPPTEDADIYGQSMPIPVQFALNVHSTERIAAAEKQELDGLEKAGFKLDFGHDGSGIYRKYITRGGGYYIDVGCSQLVIDGKIHVKQSAKGIKGFEANQLVLADGSKLDADIVVLATGYDNTRTTARKVMGNKIADRLQDVWDINEEGEVNAMWRYSGQPNFWYMGGSLALCRFYSRLLALQIKAAEEGIYVRPQPK